MYYDPTCDHGKMRYECALLEFLIFVTSLSFNEFKSIKILFHGPKRITKGKEFILSSFFFFTSLKTDKLSETCKFRNIYI